MRGMGNFSQSPANFTRCQARRVCGRLLTIHPPPTERDTHGAHAPVREERGSRSAPCWIPVELGPSAGMSRQLACMHHWAPVNVCPHESPGRVTCRTKPHADHRWFGQTCEMSCSPHAGRYVACGSSGTMIRAIGTAPRGTQTSAAPPRHRCSQPPIRGRAGARGRDRASSSPTMISDARSSRVARAMHMSRSVTTPTSFPSSSTGTMPQSPSSIRAAAATRFVRGEHVRGSRGHDVLDLHRSLPYAALFAVLTGSSIRTFLTFASGRAGSGMLTSRTPSENVALTSSSFTPSGSATAR